MSETPYGKLDILSFNWLRVKNLSSMMNFLNITFMWRGITPSNISCMISEGSPSTTWKNFDKFKEELFFTPYTEHDAGSADTKYSFLLSLSRVLIENCPSTNYRCGKIILIHCVESEMDLLCGGGSNNMMIQQLHCEQSTVIQIQY
jgi:hypothetical protein